MLCVCGGHGGGSRPRHYLGRGSTVGGADGRAARCRRSRAGTSLGIRPLGRAEDGVDALEVLRLEDERAHLIYE